MMLQTNTKAHTHTHKKQTDIYTYTPSSEMSLLAVPFVPVACSSDGIIRAFARARSLFCFLFCFLYEWVCL